ncbi:HPr family phosphocarrier protein [Utexia brackfieldae]|uniref:HPr family phosphocarrier protein n=1 Tax=Utexia brackfieldae TaxID=3074108 RepID=UPI00370D009D
MIKETVTVKNKTGIHARPAGVIVKTAGKYQSTIELVYNGKTLKAKGIMGLLGAGIKGGSEIEIICDGADEKEAMAELKGLFESGFGEE